LEIVGIGFWSDKKILVTGGASFLGSFIIEKLMNKYKRFFDDNVLQ
jgi:nucleoside-diphosphate-sugar epimerase